MNITSAKSFLKWRCFEYEAKYIKGKEEYLKSESWESLSTDIRTWFACQEGIATGFGLWCATTYRHVAPFGAAYKSYYNKRISEGVTYMDDANASESLLSGGFESHHAF